MAKDTQAPAAANLPSWEQLDNLSDKEISQFSPETLLLIQEQLTNAANTLKKRFAIFVSGLELRYEEKIKEQFEGQDLGTCHIHDEEFQCDAKRTKTVTWDQQKLGVLWDQLKAAGKDPSVYMQRDLSVLAAVYKNFSPEVQATFKEARTEKFGKVSLSISKRKDV